MNANLKKYKVSPSIVEADKESTITIKSIDGNLRFFEDITYNISFIPQDKSDVPSDDGMSLTGYNISRKIYKVKPVDGKIKIKHFFADEQEWRIHISTDEYEKHQNPLYDKYRPHWDIHIDFPKSGIDLYIYSLKKDLYGRKPLRGDFHAHTNASDGLESPEMTCAYYRKSGRDFIAITDHNLFNTSEAAANSLSFIKNFKIIHGEEVHNGYAGFFHMVNIGGKYSVNDIFFKNPERVKKELADLEKEIEIPLGLDKKEYLYRVWIYREIKKSKGYAIFPHPFWNIGFNHTSFEMSRAIIKNGLCDAFEIFGGCTPKGNNMQLALYNDLKAEGYDIPMVASTDSHSVIRGDHLKYSSIVFSNGDIIDSVNNKYCVAVESLDGENTRVYGNLRLVAYAHFLLENYYPLHDELCAASGLFIEKYISGYKNAKGLILQCENLISEYEDEFMYGNDIADIQKE